MRIRALACALASVCIVSSARSLPTKYVVADHNPIKLGETVTLRWYFTGAKVVVSGGQFGSGTEVTGMTSVTDTPVRATQYNFDVDYLGTPAGATDAATNIPLHAKYSITVQIASAIVEPMATYVNPYGWQVSYLKGWKRDNVDLPDPANNALMYFQPEEDSIERLAVSILPVKDPSPAKLMQSIQADIYSRYDSVELIAREELNHQDAPAILTTFSGID